MLPTLCKHHFPACTPRFLGLRVLLCPLPWQPLKSWVQRSMTSHVTCGPWVSSCISCEYSLAPPHSQSHIHLPVRGGGACVYHSCWRPPSPSCRGPPDFGPPEGLPVPSYFWGKVRGCIAMKYAWLLVSLVRGLGHRSILPLPTAPCPTTSSLPQPVWLPALLLQHGPGHLPRDEEENPPGPVWLPQS